MEKKKTENKKAWFGAGCFWHVEEAFRCLKGVLKTTVGYMGGDDKKYPSPTYEQVSSDKTGFVETCEVEYNPKEISYNELMKVFWKIHNPTQFNRQGLDFGSQYKSIIFYADEKQKDEAEKSKKLEQEKYSKKIVTEIRKAGKFYKAEEYHQKYLAKRGKQSCGI